jgi:hypothetical protein
MDGTGSGSCPVAGFLISYAESSSSATTVSQTVVSVQLEVHHSNEVSCIILFVCLGNIFCISF